MQTVRLTIVIVLACVSLWAQATSQIQGIIQDSSGAVVPGVEIKATQTDTGVVRTASSVEDGRYVLQNLPIGPYRLEVSAPGFSPYVQTGIVLQVASIPTVNIILQVGAVTEQVQVEANAALVETQTTSIGAVIENQRILELPLNGRNPVELIQLAGAAIPAGRVGTAGMPGGLNIAVAGGLLNGVGYYLDGIPHNNPYDATNLPFPFPDALQEFKVETSTMTAMNGTHSAGAVNAVVKPGTNEFHGSAFEFVRNGKLNARNFFAARRDTLKRNQFGGTLGGPIVKDKAFFFGGYQMTRTRSDPADRPGFVPTTRMLAGDFSGCNFPQLRDPITRVNYPNNQIPASQFSPQALAIVKMLPAAVGPCGQVAFGPITRTNEYQIIGRGDYTISEKQTLFGRYMATSYFLPAAYSLSNNILDTVQGGLDDLAQSATIGHTYLINSNTVNTFRLGANRVAVNRYNDDYFSGCDIGVKVYCYIPHQTVVTVTGGPTIGNGTSVLASFYPQYYTLSNDVSMIRGSHQFAFGYSSFKYQQSQSSNVFSTINFGFNGSDSGAGMSDFLLGRLGTMTTSAPSDVPNHKWYHGLYAQDTWKVSRRFTANLGLRWEPFLATAMNNGAIYTFSWDRFNQGIRSTKYKKAPAGLYFPGDPGFQGDSGVTPRFNQFAPRVGLAFDPKGDGTTSIRASFGVAYDFPNQQLMSVAATAPPFGNTVQPPGPMSFADPWANFPGGNPFPTVPNPDAPFVTFGSFAAQQPDAKATTIYSWNLALQRQFGRSWMVSATYMGTQTAHLWVSEQLNPAVIVPGPLTCPAGVTTGCNSTTNTNQRRLAYLRNPQEGQYLSYVDQIKSDGTASYHGLILSAQQRMSRGVSFNANYTWSHCIGDVPVGASTFNVGAGLLDPNNRKFDRGNCQQTSLDGTFGLDRRHIANFSVVLETPRFSNKALNVLASNWKLASSYRVNSGAFLTLTTGIDFQLSGTNNQRPNRVLENPLCEDPRPACWINPAAFAQPALGTLGNTGRSSVPGPGFFQIDTALSRIFRIKERQTVELRVEAFNLTNSFRAGPGAALVVTARNNPQFGQILSAQDPRIMQLALKLGF
jgi:hypothetical protein